MFWTLHKYFLNYVCVQCPIWLFFHLCTSLLSCFPGLYWYHFCFYIVIIVIININNKIANNINAIPQLGFCSLGYSEVTYYQGFESWVGNLFAGKFVFHGCKLHKHGEFLCIFSSEFYPINAWIWYLLVPLLLLHCHHRHHHQQQNS